MGFKTITIKDRTYNGLLKFKNRNESFSDLFERLIKPKEKIDLMKFYGAWKIDNKRANKIENAIKEYRKNAEKRYKERLKVVINDSAR